MAITVAEFKARFPEFTDSDDRIQLFINDATPFFDLCRWGNFYAVGFANFVAHNLALSNQRIADAAASGVSGGASLNSQAITSERVGDVAVTYGSNTSGNGRTNVMDNPYMKTTYGQVYYKYVRLAGLGAVAV